MDQSPRGALHFCPRCGTGVAADDRFCRGCGFDLSSAAALGEAAAGLASPSGWASEPAYQSVPVTPATPAAFSYAAPAEAAPATAARSGGPGKVVAAVLAVVIVAAGALVLSGAIKTPLTSHAVAGTFLLRGDATTIKVVSGSGCSGDGGYGDVQPGQPVTVKDEKGTILDATTLGSGTGTSLTGCSFTFTMHVPDTAAFYVFTMGRRGDVTFSHADMAGNGWSVALSLGS